jgi:aryl-alcohol dehydrogenase-like predicted oxidoreductase
LATIEDVTQQQGDNGFYRMAQGRRVSSIGIGTYLGEMDEATDRAYVEAVAAAVRGGINVIDTSLNYRTERSERNIGEALKRLFADGVAREELLVCTKAGFLVPGALPAGLKAEDVVGNMHCMTPAFLEDQLERSRKNLGVEAVDVFYLHNPETQLKFASREAFEERVRAAFGALEQFVREGRIAWYGTATWNGYRLKEGHPERLSLRRMIQVAQEAGGEEHHFRFIQLPVNLGMAEAFTQPHETLAGEAVSVLEVGARSGVTVVASASLLQARLASGLPEELRAKWKGPKSDAQFALQFARSTPGVTVALAGMSKTEHVRENLGLRGFAPAAADEYLRLFEREG